MTAAITTLATEIMPQSHAFLLLGLVFVTLFVGIALFALERGRRR